MTDHIEAPLPQPEHTDHHGGVLVGRRAFTTGAAAVTTTLSVGLAPDFLNEGQQTPDEATNDVAREAEGAEAQHSPELAEKHSVDDNTASAMTTLFGGLVGGNTLGIQPFTRQTVKIAWAAEGARLVALKVGGEDHAFSHDMHEFFAHKPLKGEIGSALFWGLLPAVADVASEVKIDLDGIRREGYKDPEADATAHEIVNELLEVAAVLPETSAPTAEWEQFEADANDAFVEAFAVGTGAAIAGLGGTTYLGARVGGETLREMYTRSYNHEFAKVVLEARRSDQNLSDAEIKQAAVARANKLMKGAMKFMVAADCNGLGEAGAGDPPEAVFFLSHLSEPKAIAKNEVIGLGFAETSTLMNAAGFLMAHGYAKDIKSALTQLIKNQKNTAKAMTKSIFDRDIRQESWGGSHMTAERIVEAIDARFAGTEVTEDSVERIKELVRSIPQPTLEMDARSYMRKKLNFMLDKADDSRFMGWVMQTMTFMASANDVVKGRVARDENLRPEVAELADDLSFIEQFAAREDETKREFVARIVGDVGDRADEDIRKETSDIADVFETMLRLDEGEQGQNEQLEARISELLPREIINRKGIKGELRRKRLAGQISQKAYELINSDGVVTSENVGELLEIYGILTGVDTSIVRHALVQASDSYHGMAPEHEHPKTLLSEEGEEVFTALGTQIPFVPSLVHTAERALEKIESFEGKLNAVFTLTAGVSAFGDNVAAQLFAISVLSNLYSEQMGAEAFEANIDLQHNIAIAATKLAEAAGALSLIGNGPNFVIRGTQGRINEAGEMETYEVKYEMAPSLLNGYAVAQTALAFFTMKKLIKSAVNSEEFALAA